MPNIDRLLGVARIERALRHWWQRTHRRVYGDPLTALREQLRRDRAQRRRTRRIACRGD